MNRYVGGNSNQLSTTQHHFDTPVLSICSFLRLVQLCLIRLHFLKFLCHYTLIRTEHKIKLFGETDAIIKKYFMKRLIGGGW